MTAVNLTTCHDGYSFGDHRRGDHNNHKYSRPRDHLQNRKNHSTSRDHFLGSNLLLSNSTLSSKNSLHDSHVGRKGHKEVEDVDETDHRAMPYTSKTSKSPFDLEKWMELLPPSVRSRPLSHLLIPGTHDCGSYGLQTRYGISPDHNDLKNAWWFKYFPKVALKITKRWTRTQGANTREQLRHGVRYFDFRGAPRRVVQSGKLVPTGIDLYFVHGLYGPRIVDMLSTIKTFLEKNTKEVVILHFQHFYAVDEKMIKNLLEHVERIFGDKIARYPKPPEKEEEKKTEPHVRIVDGNPDVENDVKSTSPKTLSNSTSPKIVADSTAAHVPIPSLEEMSAKGHQVIIFFPAPEEITPPETDLLWPCDLIPNPWPNTTKIPELQEFLEDNIPHRPKDAFFVTQGILTPDSQYITRHLPSSLRHSLAIPCNQWLEEWLDGQYPGSDGPNIVMVDFCNWNDFVLTRKVVRKNFKDHQRTA